MSLLATAASVCFVACHGGPADHFAAFTESLSKNVPIEIYASGPALKKFQERNIEVKFPFSLENITPEEEDALAELIATTCRTASVVMTDVGHAFDIKVQKALARLAGHSHRIAYYDNSESEVPGYSETAAQVMLAANEIVVANSNLAKEPIYRKRGEAIDFGTIKKTGIGYYPIHQAEKIADRRAAEQTSMRQNVLQKNGLADTGQKVLVYFGGNNEEYFEKSFPAFLSFIEEGMEQSDFSNLVIVVQQHPGAKSKNLDANKLNTWLSQNSKKEKAPKIILSNFSSDDAQVIADGALYHQTSMCPQFLLAGIPTMQVGHNTFDDVLVRNNLVPSATNASQFTSAINGLTHSKKEIPREVIFKGLGINSDWLEILEKTLQSNRKIIEEQRVSTCGFQAKKSHLPFYMAAGVFALIGFFAVRYLKPRYLTK